MYAQGVVILATSGQNFTDDNIYNTFRPNGTKFDDAFYGGQIKQIALYYGDCISTGSGGAPENPFCTYALLV